MHRERVEKWITALRSGEYTQGRTFLNNNGSFCCLGVACEVAINSGLFVSKTKDSGRVFLYGRRSNMPPKAVRTFFGITNNQMYRLADLNDQYRRTFNEIADYLEEELEEKELEGRQEAINPTNEDEGSEESLPV